MFARRTFFLHLCVMLLPHMSLTISRCVCDVQTSKIRHREASVLHRQRELMSSYFCGLNDSYQYWERRCISLEIFALMSAPVASTFTRPIHWLILLLYLDSSMQNFPVSFNKRHLTFSASSALITFKNHSIVYVDYFFWPKNVDKVLTRFLLVSTELISNWAYNVDLHKIFASLPRYFETPV